MDIVDRIFELVDKKYSEQRQFALELQIPASRISEWRLRKSTSYNKRLPQIAEVLETSVEYLLMGKKEEPTVKDDGLTQAEQALMDVFRQLTPDQQDMVIRMVQAAADKK